VLNRNFGSVWEAWENLSDADTTPVAQVPNHLVSEAAVSLILAIWNT